MKMGIFLISILYSLFILSFSLQSGETSGSLSGSFVEAITTFVSQMFPRLIIDIELWHTIIRKIAHMASFGIAGVLWTISFQGFRKKWIYILGIGLVLSVVGEVLQLFVQGRGPSIIDALVFNYGGYLLGGTFCFIIIINRKYNKKNNVS
ncbi:MAG: VanZ family protein [Candidatus Izemoplasmatales bacterium]|jgi:VanZ family protein|nr:VanZ family protein [bacterium]MDZ4197454.1 VanZ family protein [Candidatus Izemoplasmatales bacterium]